MQFDVQDIYNRLLSINYYENLFSDLGNLKKEGKELLTQCPFCSGHRFSISTTKPVWKCWNCDESGDYISYLQKVKNFDFKEAVAELGKEVGIEVSFSSEYQEQYEQKKRKLSLFDTVQDLFKISLAYNSNQSNYLLHTRKYEQKDIDLMDLGAYPSTDKVKSFLLDKGFSDDEINASGLVNSRFEKRISIPYPDKTGRTIGFSFRAINNEDQPKYLNTAGLNKDGLVGFQFRPYKPKSVLVVEGILDALFLNVKGLKDYWILALGGVSLSQKQVKVIEDAGIEEIVLAFDNDDAGRRGTKQAIETLRLSKLRVYCLLWNTEDYKDPDEFVKEEGIENFSLYLRLVTISWGEWLARYLASHQYLVGTNLGNDRYLSECLEIESTIWDPIEKNKFTSTYLGILSPEGITEIDIAQRREKKYEQTAKSKAKDVISNLNKQLAKLLKEEDLTASELAIEGGLEKLKASRGIELPSPYFPEDFLLDISQMGEGMTTGWENLDLIFKIPTGAITLVAARPSIGKTTFMLNLFLNLVDLYPDRSFYFFSYEEAKSRLAIKLIQILSNEIINEEFNHNAYISYFKYDRSQGKVRDRIEEGFYKYSELVKSGRLWLLDKRINDDDLVATINLLSSSRNIGAVFIDYIQKIPCSNQSNQDWLNIKTVSQSILDCAVSLDIPIILGCQLNRSPEATKDKRPTLGALRQSGDLEQDANIVLGLHRPDFYQDLDVTSTGEMEIITLKNRNGERGKSGKLFFTPPTLKLSNFTLDRDFDDYSGF